MQIRGTGTLFSGQMFETSGSLVIGRGNGCNIIAPDGARGISRMHCRIDDKGGYVTVTDLGSSYGTYVNGARIAANNPVTLRPGESFYLGGASNSFVVNGNSAVMNQVNQISNIQPCQKNGNLANSKHRIIIIAIAAVAAVIIIGLTCALIKTTNDYNSLQNDYNSLQQDTLVTRSGTIDAVESIFDTILSF